MKIPFVGPDVEQAVHYTLRLTVLHNFIPIMLSLACLGSLIFLIINPSRLRVLLLIGFGLLLLHFEYLKHIMEPLVNQTTVSLITVDRNYRFEWLVQKMLTKGIPLLLFLTGWICIIGPAAFLFFKKKKGYNFLSKLQKDDKKHRHIHSEE